MQSHAILLLKYIYLILKMFIFTEHHDKENYFLGGGCSHSLSFPSPSLSKPFIPVDLQALCFSLWLMSVSG